MHVKKLKTQKKVEVRVRRDISDLVVWISSKFEPEFRRSRILILD